MALGRPPLQASLAALRQAQDSQALAILPRKGGLIYHKYLILHIYYPMNAPHIGYTDT
jgi:hypothetical protein